MEVLVTLGIVGILAAVLIPVVPKLIAESERARCMGNLRNLHTAFNNYVTDNGQWPQEPRSKREDWTTRWWLWTMKPYGLTPETWICPTIKRAVRSDPNVPQMHYVPTQFDKDPQTPFKWKGQPWFIEIASAHVGGPLICFADGSILPLKEVKTRKK